MPNEIQAIKEMTPEQIGLLSRTIAKGATKDELDLFVGMCKRTQLDPFTRQIYFIKDKNGKVMMQISVDGFRVIAERSGLYAGQDAPVFEEDANGNVVKCSVAVYRWHNDIRYQASVGVAYMKEYAKPGRNGYESNWDKLPRTMISKVAECIALRKAFPNDLSGLYSPEEMEQATVEPQDLPKPIVAEQPTEVQVPDRKLTNETPKTAQCAVCQQDFVPLKPNYTKCPKCFFIK